MEVSGLPHAPAVLPPMNVKRSVSSINTKARRYITFYARVFQSLKLPRSFAFSKRFFHHQATCPAQNNYLYFTTSILGAM
jgi:hypothetical protein